MNFVIDENVSFGVADKLRSSGHKVISIAEDLEQGLSDEEIFALCKKTKSILITRDYHFTNPIRFPPKVQKVLYTSVMETYAPKRKLNLWNDF